MPDIDYEHLPDDEPPDETDLSLRAYFTGLSDGHLSNYDPLWSNDKVIDWDGNFRSDGALMLVCCERDVEIEEFRRVLEQHLQHRQISQ